MNAYHVAYYSAKQAGTPAERHMFTTAERPPFFAVRGLILKAVPRTVLPLRYEQAVVIVAIAKYQWKFRTRLATIDREHHNQTSRTGENRPQPASTYVTSGKMLSAGTATCDTMSLSPMAQQQPATDIEGSL